MSLYEKSRVYLLKRLRLDTQSATCFENGVEGYLKGSMPGDNPYLIILRAAREQEDIQVEHLSNSACAQWYQGWSYKCAEHCGMPYSPAMDEFPMESEGI